VAVWGRRAVERVSNGRFALVWSRVKSGGYTATAEAFAVQLISPCMMDIDAGERASNIRLHILRSGEQGV